jgi:CubicO group peptidase (beta-lactamase class C family)
LRSLAKWTILAAVVALTLVIAGNPPYWQRRLVTAVYGTSELPASFYTPRAIVKGGNQPPAPRESPVTESLDPQALRAAAAYARAHESLALIVTRHGYIVFENYWAGSSLDTVVNSQGLGRVVTALATGVAISERKIGWPDEPVGYFIREWANDPRGQITVRNLLQLSSGLGPDRVRLAPPGSRWVDQPVDPDLLAEVIQKATGTAYAQYVSQSIWKRIGAADASIWLGSGGRPHADAGFFARQGDWLRVAELLLKNGNYQGDEIIVPRWVPELLKPSKSNADYGSYLHLGTHAAAGTSPYAADDVFVVEGRGSRLWLVPSLQIAILRTGPPPSGDWDEARIPNLIVRGARDFVPPAARPGADLRQIVPNH